jgi:CBS domain-containing protein
MSSTEIPAAAGSYRTPTLEHARARDAMHHGVITCPPETSLTTVARMLAHSHVHAVVVTQPHTESDEEESTWAVVTDLDVLRARADTDAATAGGSASRDVVIVAPDDPLDWVAERMVEHHTSHAVVVTRENDHPVGMISTLDLAGAVGWGRA